MSAGAKNRLMSELKTLEKEKWVNIDVDDTGLFKWNIALIVLNSDSAFDGGYFKAEMTFSNNYPYEPPTFKFIRPIYHPNIYPDGKLCISILHAPGEDEMSGESASERWSPLQGVESVLRSVLLLLDDPETSSPANVDAGVMYRNDRAQYNKMAKEAVDASEADIPAGFEMPKTLTTAPPTKMDEDEDFWAPSDNDEEDDFGGSNSSEEEDEDDEMQEFDDSEEEEDSEEKDQ